jgi:predicted MFS family arabinose efflux permease
MRPAGPHQADVWAPSAGQDAQAGRQRVYTLVLLTAATFFYQLDRNVVYIVQELIKIEFRLSDTQLGLVTGLAYGLANGLAGLPMGWLIDRANRAKLLAACVSTWSAMTALCGLATTFPFLLAARVGVGLAESGGTPTSLSIVSDLYAPERRASKIGIISAGYSLGTIVSALAGGYIAAEYGWRAAFLLYGAPGLLLGLLMLTTLREPPRTRSAGDAPIRFADVLRSAGWLVRQPGLRMIYLATAMTSMVSTGVYSWWSSFMMRVHHLDLPSVGWINTVGPGICGVLGMILTGVAADWARRRAAGGPLMVIAATSAITFVAAGTALWTPSTAVMIAALVVAGGTMGAYIGPGNAVVSELTPLHLRGLAFSIPVVITNLVGAALGPLVVGVLSDAVQGALPQVQPLRAAMSAVLLLQVPVVVIYFLAGRARTRQARASG